MRHEASVMINAPADAVWQVIVSVQDWPQWTPTVDSAQRLDEGSLQLGSRTRMSQPRLRPTVWTVTELDPGRSFIWTTGGPMLRMVAAHTARPQSRGTVVDLSFEVSGPMAWLAGLLGGKMIRQYVDTEAASLKKWCERVSDEHPEPAG